jgi:hypothetical protein
MFATVPNPVVFDGLFHVKVHCAAEAPEPCKGGVYVKVKGKGEAMGSFRVAAGATKTVVADPAFDPGHPKGPVDVRIESGNEPPVTVSRKLVVRKAPDPGGGEEWKVKHTVRDKAGDGAGPLDLRKVEAHVRHRRLIITWTCWGTVTPAKMDHDVASFHAFVYTSQPAGHTRKSAAVFYGDHGPVIFAGTELGPNDWGGRFYRPNAPSARISVPVRRFGPHVRHFWLLVSTMGYHGGEDQIRDFIYFKV